MRKCLFLLLVLAGLITPMVGHAQVKLGLKGGFNLTRLDMNEEIIDSKNRNGFYFGPTLKVTLPLLVGFDVSALYDRREMRVGDAAEKVKQEMVTVPLNVRLNLGNERQIAGVIYAGPQIAFNIGDRHKVVDEAREWKFKDSNFSLNFGAGVMLGGVLQATVNYNLALGKTAEVNNGVVTDALHKLENIEAKTNAWQLGLAVFF